MTQDVKKNMIRQVLISGTLKVLLEKLSICFVHFVFMLLRRTNNKIVSFVTTITITKDFDVSGKPLCFILLKLY